MRRWLGFEASNLPSSASQPTGDYDYNQRVIAWVAAERGLAFGQFGIGASMEFPIAWLSILLETSMGQMSSMGRIIGQGNFGEAKAMLKKAGNAIATSQRMVFHFSRFFFSSYFI